MILILCLLTRDPADAATSLSIKSSVTYGARTETTLPDYLHIPVPFCPFWDWLDASFFWLATQITTRKEAFELVSFNLLFLLLAIAV